MKSFVQQIDVIISLCWIHKTVLQSDCGCFLNFCTFRLVESTERMVLKASFQTLQGHSFVWIYFPFPSRSLAPNTALQIGSDWQAGWSQQGPCQVPLPGSAHPGPASYPLSGQGGLAALRNRTWYTCQVAPGDSYSTARPHFDFYLDCVRAELCNFATHHLFSLLNIRSSVWFCNWFLEGSSKWRHISVSQWHPELLYRTNHLLSPTGFQRSLMWVLQFSKTHKSMWKCKDMNSNGVSQLQVMDF